MCSACDTRHVTLARDHNRGKDDRILTTTNGTYASYVIQILRTDLPSHNGDGKIFEVMASTWPLSILGLVASVLAATIY